MTDEHCRLAAEVQHLRSQRNLADGWIERACRSLAEGNAKTAIKQLGEALADLRKPMPGTRRPAEHGQAERAIKTARERAKESTDA